MAVTTDANSSVLGNESASTNSSQSPEAHDAPVLRARPIWLIGSKTTIAPASAAISLVRSVELLSQTISSLPQPAAAHTVEAALRSEERRVGKASRSGRRHGHVRQ